MTTTSQINAILRKDGKDWTNEDRKALNQFAKDNGRAKLKSMRKRIRLDNTNQPE